MKRWVEWSDYLFLHNPDRHRICSLDVFGEDRQTFDDIPNHLIERFIQAYKDNPLIKLVKVVKDKNVATGYPVWQFHCEEVRN